MVENGIFSGCLYLLPFLCYPRVCYTVSAAEPKKACELVVPWGMAILDRMIN